MVDDPRFEVEDDDVKATLRALGLLLSEAVKDVNKDRPDQPKYGFGLFLFEFDPGTAMFWISNAKRADIQRALREFLAREGGH